MEIKYQEALPILPAQLTAWEIRFPSGEKRIYLWHKDTTLEDVHRHVALRHSEFKIGALDVGGYVSVSGVADSAYRSDARRVDQDWNVTLD